MSKHESTRKPKLPAVLMAAALSASALAGCYDGGETAPKPTIPAAEQARMDAEHAEHVNKLQALNIENSPISSEIDDGSMSMAEKTKATYDSVKAYVDYAKSEDLPLRYYDYYYQTGSGTTCELKLDDEQNVVVVLNSSGFSNSSYRTVMTLAPDQFSYSLSIYDGSKEGPVWKDDEVTGAQLPEVTSIISAVQTSTLEGSYCAETLYITDVLTNRFA